SCWHDYARRQSLFCSPPLPPSPYPLHLPSSPTRRSSDLGLAGQPDDERGKARQRHGWRILQKVEPANRLERPQPSAPEERHGDRSEEHTSELQSHLNLVCRLLLEKQKHQTGERDRPVYGQ